MANSKKITPLFQSLTRPILILGGERENVILIACLSLMLWTAGRDVISIVLAIVVWTAGVIISKVVAKADPWATKVFLKSIQYQDFYPAREKIVTPNSVIKRKRDF